MCSGGAVAHSTLKWGIGVGSASSNSDSVYGSSHAGANFQTVPAAGAARSGGVGKVKVVFK